jgi:hypothetical protein
MREKLELLHERSQLSRGNRRENGHSKMGRFSGKDRDDRERGLKGRFKNF